MAASVANSGDPTKEKKSKWRLSNPFHKDGSNGQQNLEPRDTRDSAYGGSETTTTDPSPNPSTTAVPTISESQAEAQGAQVHTKTDTRGRVITTTTTTVTTTTTTTEGDSLQVPAGEEVIVRQDDHEPRATTPIGHASSHDGYGEPSIPAKSAMRSKSPHGHLAPQNQYPAEVPASPSSPTQHNFSYPGRQARSSFDQQQSSYRGLDTTQRPRPPEDPSYGQPPLAHNSESPQYQRESIPPSLRPGNAPPEPAGYQPRQSTAQSIRTAAAGIHGAGETLRGALNSNIARYTGGTQDEIAKHDAITQRGRQEIESGHFVKAPPTIPEVPTPEEAPKEKKTSKLKNVLRKKSPARNA